ncbi:MAG: hypothetical protein WAU02_01625 [Candidatus Saccharimonadales bacterium]
MNTISITSQGQITIPAKVRKAWGISGASELRINFDQKTRRLTVEKPLSVEDFLAITEPIMKKLPKNNKPIPADKIHEFYETHRAKEIVERMRESL